MSQLLKETQLILNKEATFLPDQTKIGLIDYIDISKGKILTLLKTVFSFLSDNSLLKKDSASSFEKYLIDSKFIQTMQKIYYFYSSNFPENGKFALHELIKERYAKYLKYYEQNDNYFLNNIENLYRFYLVQGFILLWLIETNYDSEYYDELIRLINSLKRLEENENGNENSDNKYLNKFLKTIIKFPFIRQNKETIIKVLEVNECDNSIISFFNESLNNYIQKSNSKLKRSLNDEKSTMSNIIGKKNIKTKNEDSYFSLFKENPMSYKRKSYSNASSHKGIITSINSSGFYTPEFRHSKRDSIRHFRRFSINNMNNPRITVSSKDNSFSRGNSLSDGMSNLLMKCEEGKHKNNSSNNKLNKNGPSTKSKLRLAVQGHFYTEDDYKNNIDIRRDDSSISSFSEKNGENIINNNMINIDNDIACENDILDIENETENTIVSVDELPINANLSIISNSNSKNIGLEPENIIQETKEEEEIDEYEQINEKNKTSNNYVKILTDNEIKDFFDQQFVDNQKNKKPQPNIKVNNNNINKNRNKSINVNNEMNGENRKKKKHNNKNKKRSNSSINNSNNSSKDNSINNNLMNRSNKNELNANKNRQNSKKNIINNNNLVKNKSKDKNNISAQHKMIKMKNYSNQNVFGIIKSHKNNKSDLNNMLKNKNDNIILQPCTKGKELMNNVLGQQNGNSRNVSKEKLPTDSVAKKNLLSLYNQMKNKK